MFIENKKEGTRDKIFMWSMAFLAFLWYLKDCDSHMSFYNSTLYAFSYKYGFISRGFVGSVYQLLDMVLPIDMMKYQSVYYFSICMTVLFYIVLLLFLSKILKVTEHTQKHNVKLLIAFLGIFMFPMFWTAENMGRIDIYFLLLVFLCVYLIMHEKLLWAVVPLLAICMCIHQGFTFTSANLILVMLFYKAMMAKQNNKKYMKIFILSFVVISILFLYFEFGNHLRDTTMIETLITDAKNLSASGNDYNETIIDHELLGQGVFAREKSYHICNMQETPVFLILFFPYILIAWNFFRNLLRGTKGKERLAYLAVALGNLTLLPELILKVDYGRYAFFTFFYYIVIVMVLIALKDEKTIFAFEETKQKIKRKVSMPYLLLVYPAIFMPFSDWFISDVSLAVMDLIKSIYFRLPIG